MLIEFFENDEGSVAVKHCMIPITLLLIGAVMITNLLNYRHVLGSLRLSSHSYQQLPSDPLMPL